MTNLQESEFFRYFEGEELKTAEAFVEELTKRYRFLRMDPEEPSISLTPHFLVHLVLCERRISSCLHEGLDNALMLGKRMHHRNRGKEADGYVLIEVGFLSSDASFEPLLCWGLADIHAPNQLVDIHGKFVWWKAKHDEKRALIEQEREVAALEMKLPEVERRTQEQQHQLTETADALTSILNQEETKFTDTVQSLATIAQEGNRYANLRLQKLFDPLIERELEKLKLSENPWKLREARERIRRALPKLMREYDHDRSRLSAFLTNRLPHLVEAIVWGMDADREKDQ